MAKISTEERVWFDNWLETPLGHPKAPTPLDAMKMPGCCVKSRLAAFENEPALGPMPMKFGVLVELNDAVAVVRGHDSPASPRFVWIGSPREYFSTWECD